jgi:uncharacterized coiled-coil protein SlyX
MEESIQNVVNEVEETWERRVYELEKVIKEKDNRIAHLESIVASSRQVAENRRLQIETMQDNWNRLLFDDELGGL